MTSGLPNHRRASTKVFVRHPDGQPVADREVSLELESHAFGFGNIGVDLVNIIGGTPPEGSDEVEAFGGTELPGDPESYKEHFLQLFNMVTLPFYWGRYEPRKGQRDEARLRKTAEWLIEHGVRVKGHPLVWHTSQPGWMLDEPKEQVEELVRARVRNLTSVFAGTVDHWDAINEAVIMPVFTNGENAVTPLAKVKGRVGMVRLAVEEARAGNPNVRLVLNDFDLSERYEQLVEEVLAAGIQIDAIGLQSHMHKGYRGEEWVLSKIEAFERFGLPLQLTETTLVSGHIMPSHIEDLNDYKIPDWPTTPEGEERQAEEIERHYRCVFGQPAVESLTYWGITDTGSWLGAPSGLLRKDGSTKPSFNVLDGLINGEWGYTAGPQQTDAEGGFQLEGPKGRYRVSVGGNSTTVELDGTESQMTSTLQ